MHEQAENQNIVVSADDAGRRLDAFLAATLDGVSRSRLQKAIAEGDVTVNEKNAKASLKLRAGDVIDVEIEDSIGEEFTAEMIPLDVVFEDEHLIVVNKPAGMVVHPGAGVSSGTLANALAWRFQNSSGDSPVPPRVGIVHRIDKDTSGLLVVAKTEAMHEKLSELFREREVFKEYVALVHGEFWDEDRGVIEAPIAREKHHRTKMGIRAHGRYALSLWKVKKRFEKFTLVGVEIKTGRTHQIRVHMAHINHPIVGDETYNSGRDKTVHDLRIRKAIGDLGRFFLHAEKLAFDHPATGEKLSFVQSLPGELTEFIELLETE